MVYTAFFTPLRFSGEPLAWLLAFGALGLFLTFSGMIDLIKGQPKKSSRVSGTALIAAGLMALGGGVYVSLTSAEASYKHNRMHQQTALLLDQRYGKLIRIRDFALDGYIVFTAGRVHSCTYSKPFVLIKSGGAHAETKWVIAGKTDANQRYPVSDAGFRQMSIDCDGQMPQD